MKIENSYLYKIITNEGSFPGKKIILLVLKILSYIYCGVVKLRLFLYKIGFFKTYNVDIPVISIGNISVGGSGKTAFTQTVSNLIKDEFNRKPAVLLRGYGAKVRSLNDNGMARIDEEEVLKENLNDIPILEGKNRVKNGKDAVRKFKSDCIILDDGFQYLKLKKDLNIVLVKPHTILEEKYLLPRGFLREPFTHLERADLVVVTDIDRVSGDKKESIQSYLHHFYPYKIVLYASYFPTQIYNIMEGKEENIESLKRKEFISFSGIGDPGSFRYSLKKQSLKIKSDITYGDHHNYNMEDIRDIINKTRELGLVDIVTTQKDICKINPYLNEFTNQDMNLFVMKIELRLIEEKYRRELYDKLSNLFNNQIS